MVHDPTLRRSRAYLCSCGQGPVWRLCSSIGEPAKPEEAPGQYQAHVEWHALRRGPMEEVRQPKLKRLGGHCRFRALRQINDAAHQVHEVAAGRVVGAHSAHVP